MGIKKFFKDAFHDMKESTRAQHEVDKANFQAVRAEGKATWEEAKLSPRQRQELINKQRQKQIEKANERTAKANERIENVKAIKNK